MTDPELVRLVAEKVMGYQPCGTEPWNDGYWFRTITGGAPVRFDPLSSMACAFEIIHTLQTKGWQSVELKYFKPGKRSHPALDETYWALYLGRDSEPFDAYARADTPQMAICLCALKTVGVDVQEPTCKP